MGGVSRKIMSISFIWYLLLPYASLVIGRLGKLARLWIKNFLMQKEEIFPCKSSVPWLLLVGNQALRSNLHGDKN